MSRKIVKKILPEYFDLIYEGKKKIELRLADFNVEEGGILVLEEWDSLGSDRKPTGRVLEKKITHLLKFDLDPHHYRSLYILIFCRMLEY